jgi:hypothetical protein
VGEPLSVFQFTEGGAGDQIEEEAMSCKVYFRCSVFEIIFPVCYSTLVSLRSSNTPQIRAISDRIPGVRLYLYRVRKKAVMKSVVASMAKNAHLRCSSFCRCYYFRGLFYD